VRVAVARCFRHLNLNTARLQAIREDSLAALSCINSVVWIGSIVLDAFNWVIKHRSHIPIGDG